MTQRITLTQFLGEDQRTIEGATGDFSGLVGDVAIASKAIAHAVGKGALLGAGTRLCERLRAEASDLLLGALAATTHLAATLSPTGFRPVGDEGHRGKYLLAFDPLIGAADLDINFQTGTIFSILRSPDPSRPAREEDFLQPGRDVVCAGLVQYGGSTRFVLATDLGVDGFTLDREFGEYVLTNPDLALPPTTDEVALHAMGSRSWEPPVARYVKEALAGAEGPRARDFRIRWAASLGAETYRILTRGGVYVHPHDSSTRNGGGHLHLLCAAQPVAWIAVRAGGDAITGRNSILDLVPSSLDQQVPLIFGSSDEVARLHELHRAYIEGRDEDEAEPLFSSRSLFR
ncbi:MAG: fructose-1,6-bisphosphatase [Actinomycetales bacterium]|nr:fructose-1,6-bisphosphatase [Actinomycetales bacterium]